MNKLFKSLFVIIALIAFSVFTTSCDEDCEHEFESVRVEATCSEDGYTAEKCVKCGYLQNITVIERLGHTLVVDERIEPTCTETGLTTGVHCSRCEEVLSAQEVIPALGHDIVIDEAQEATCTCEGLTEGSHCERCGEYFVEQDFIEPTGHYFVDGVCVYCNNDNLDPFASIGTLRLIARHDSKANFMQGHVYLVFTNTSDNIIKFTINNLYGSYTMTDEFKALIEEDVTNLSWRVDTDLTDGEHLAIANSYFEYSDDGDYNVFTLNPGEYITIGCYSMADNNVYAGVETLRPLVDFIDGEENYLSSLFDIYANYLLNGKLEDADYDEIQTLISEILADKTASLGYDQVMNSLSTIKTLVSKYENGTLTSNDIIEIFAPNLEEQIGETKAKLLSDAFGELYNQYVSNGTLTSTDVINALTPVLKDEFGEEGYQKLIYSFEACESLYEIYLENGTITSSDAFKTLSTIMYQILGEEKWNSILTQCDQIKKAYNDYLNGTLTNEDVQKAVIEIINTEILTPTERKLIEAISMIVQNVYKLYQNNNLTYAEVVKLLNSAAEDVMSESSYQALLQIEDTLKEIYQAYTDNNFNLETIVTIFTPYINKLLGENFITKVTSVINCAKTLYGYYQNDNLTYENVTSTLLPTLKVVLSEEKYNHLESAYKSAQNIYEYAQKNGFSPTILLIKKGDIENILDNLFGEGSGDKYNDSLVVLIPLYAKYQQGLLTEDDVVKGIKDIGNIIFNEERAAKFAALVDNIRIDYDKGLLNFTTRENIIVYLIEKWLGIDVTTDLTFKGMLRYFVSGTSEGGILVNRELYNQKYKYDQYPNEVYQEEVTMDEFNNLLTYLGNNSYFSAFNHNCSTVAIGAWNACVGVDEFDNKTASYLDASGKGIYFLFDLPKDVMSSIKNISDSLSVYLEGGLYCGSNLELPVVDYGISTRLPDAEIKADEESEEEQEQESFHTATTDAIGTLTIIAKTQKEIFNVVDHSFIMYTNTTDTVQTLEFTCDMAKVYRPTAEFMQLVEEDPTFYSWLNGNTEQSAKVAASYFYEVPKVDGKYTIILNPGEFITLGTYSSTSHINMIKQTLKYDELVESYQELLTDYVTYNEKLKAGEMTQEELKTNLAGTFKSIIQKLFVSKNDFPGVANSAGGYRIDYELYSQKYKYTQQPNVCYSADINQKQLDNFVAFVNSHSYYNFINFNCADSAADSWNAAVGYDENGNKTALYIDSAWPIKFISWPKGVTHALLQLIKSTDATAAGGVYTGSNFEVIYAGILNQETSEEQE